MKATSTFHTLIYCCVLLGIQLISYSTHSAAAAAAALVNNNNLSTITTCTHNNNNKKFLSNHHHYCWRLFSASIGNPSNDSNNMSDNKAMAFLKKIGKVGTSTDGQRDIRFAVGVDEGQAGKTMHNGIKEMKKVSHAYTSAAVSGIIDDMSESFPTTTCGTKWDGFTDQVMGGVSVGNLLREVYDDKIANVLRGKVSLENNGGFIQMATNLGTIPIDVSRFDGIELVVHNGIESDTGSEKFNVHIKTTSCLRPFSSYRATFEAPTNKWETIRIPFTQFRGNGPGAIDNPFDTKSLTRIGIVAIGKEMKVKLALAGLRFY